VNLRPLVAGITGSNPAGAWMSFSCECLCCQVEVFASAGHSSRGVLPSVVGVTECDREASEERKSW